MTPESRRAAAWRLRTRTLDLPLLPRLMGIVNVTPDSFSDGGRFIDSSKAIEHGLRLAAEGADVLDVGGESTRPYSIPVDDREELRRVLPVVQALVEQTSAAVSIDTSKPLVARECLAAGAEILNDVTGFRHPEMIEAALAFSAGVCVMHMQGTPQTMQDDPRYADVVADILDDLKQRRDRLERAGIAPDRVCLDPGVGFGKTHQHNLTLMAYAGRFHELERPILIGHSRKGFIAKILNDKTVDRTFGTVGASLALAIQGIQLIRVHDVAAVRQALLLFAACGGLDGQPVRVE
ncbi:MAG TPA: dihydropteroate synthase [Pirellulales bacterium]